MAQPRRFLQGRRIDPRPITGADSVVEVIDNAFLTYNAARLREACRLFTEKMLAPDVTVGMSPRFASSVPSSRAMIAPPSCRPAGRRSSQSAQTTIAPRTNSTTADSVTLEMPRVDSSRF